MGAGLRILILATGLFLVIGCKPNLEREIVGTYSMDLPDLSSISGEMKTLANMIAGTPSTVKLVIKSSGEAAFTLGKDTVRTSWSLKGKTLTLWTKEEPRLMVLNVEEDGKRLMIDLRQAGYQTQNAIPLKKISP